MNAKAKRIAAIDALTSKYIDPATGFATTTDRKEVWRAIDELGTLGRTVHWQTALVHWIDMVTNPAYELRWAILQGSINAGSRA